MLRRIAPEALGPTRAMLFDESGSQAYGRALRSTVQRAAKAAGLAAPLNMVF